MECPQCGIGPIATYGIGTQRVESELRTLYPNARIIRMDADSTTRVGDHARLLDRFARDGDILVGTEGVLYAHVARRSRQPGQGVVISARLGKPGKSA